MRFALRMPGSVPQFLAACYEPAESGILFTTKAEDACSYTSIQKAATVAKTIRNKVGFTAEVTVVDY
jgi:hypothetical protein